MKNGADTLLAPHSCTQSIHKPYIQVCASQARKLEQSHTKWNYSTYFSSTCSSFCPEDERLNEAEREEHCAHSLLSHHCIVPFSFFFTMSRKEARWWWWWTWTRTYSPQQQAFALPL